MPRSRDPFSMGEIWKLAPGRVLPGENFGFTLLKWFVWSIPTPSKSLVLVSRCLTHFGLNKPTMSQLAKFVAHIMDCFNYEKIESPVKLRAVHVTRAGRVFKPPARLQLDWAYLLRPSVFLPHHERTVLGLKVTPPIRNANNHPSSSKTLFITAKKPDQITQHT